MNSSRNVYRDEIDFAALALQDAEFNKYVKTNGQVNFSDPEAVKQLTKSLLKRDFGLAIELPHDRLCPPVPNRLNYVLWLQDLIDQTSAGWEDKHDKDRDVVGLDIGTGCSAVYPLLACKLRTRWRMLASDIDPQNHASAHQNILLNKLQDRITLLPLRSRSDSLIPLEALDGINRLDFCMTNPPFYASESEMLSSAAAKSRPPRSACTGAEVEMVYADGGEIGFVAKLVEESYALRDKIQWYTSMLGKLSSVGEILDVLKAKECQNWAVAEFVQGQRTRRWAVAWSWLGRRPNNETARGGGSAGVTGLGSGVEKHWLPFPSEVTLSSGYSIEHTGAMINSKMTSLDMQWVWREKDRRGIGFFRGNTWSRAARRKIAQREKAGNERMDTDDGEEEDPEPALVVRIEVRPAEVYVRWLVGLESVLFESFCGMLKRSLSEA